MEKRSEWFFFFNFRGPPNTLHIHSSDRERTWPEAHCHVRDFRAFSTMVFMFDDTSLILSLSLWKPFASGTSCQQRQATSRLTRAPNFSFCKALKTLLPHANVVYHFLRHTGLHCSRSKWHRDRSFEWHRDRSLQVASWLPAPSGIAIACRARLQTTAWLKSARL